MSGGVQKKLLFLCIALVCALFLPAGVRGMKVCAAQTDAPAQEIEDGEETALTTDELLEEVQAEIDYDEMDEAAEALFAEDAPSITMRELVEGLLDGTYGFNLQTFKTFLAGQTTDRFAAIRQQFSKLLIIGLFSAVFLVLSSALGSKQVSDIGFYAALLLLSALLLYIFSAASQVVSSMIERLLAYVKLMMPVYMVIVAASGSGTTAVIFYEGFLFLTYAADWLMLRLLLPLVQMYVVLGIVNHISKEDLFSRFAALIKQLVRWALKSVLALTVGFQLIQGLLTPYVDSFKTSALQKMLTSLPGVGNLVDGVTELAFGAGILIKNGIGAAMLLLILFACAAPMLTTGLYTLMLQTACALLQPIADKRVQNCIACTWEGVALLLRILLVTCFLFLLSIAVLTATTNVGA